MIPKFPVMGGIIFFPDYNPKTLKRRVFFSNLNEKKIVAQMVLKENIENCIKSGNLKCWTCKIKLTMFDIAFVDCTASVVGYICNKCGNKQGLRTFKSINLPFISKKDVNLDDLDLPFAVIFDGMPVNLPNALVVLAGLREPQIEKKVIAEVKEKKKKYDLNSFQLSVEYMKFLESDLKAMGEEEFWKSIVQGSNDAKKSVPEFLKMCERDFLKSMKKKEK